MTLRSKTTTIHPAKEAVIFDKEALLQNLGDDEDLIKEILCIFLKDAPRQIHSIEKAIAAGDINLVHRQAHTLKGASGNVCAEVLHAMSLELETAGEKGDLGRAESLLETIKQNFEAFKSSINTQLGELNDIIGR